MNLLRGTCDQQTSAVGESPGRQPGESKMELTNRMVAAAATFGMLFLLFAVPSARADEAGKIQDRLTAEAIVVDTTIDQARLAAAARRLAPPTVTVETRIGPNTSMLTRVPVALAQR
jgi:hypothetical protein